MTRSGPALAHTRAELAALLDEPRRAGAPVALVPTMGALHEGHASLVRAARDHAPQAHLVVSVFVNPLQFSDGEDLERYPRTLDEDVLVCAREGVDVVFAPTVEEVYPGGPPQVSVDPGSVAELLEGRSRPGHFRGVLTVVAKLLGLVRPDVAVFGEKDYQQLVLIRRMVLDLNLGVEVLGAETQREPDGLALSSRNRFLGDEDRAEALTLSACLRAAQGAAVHGVDAALTAARAELRRAEGVDLDYLSITDPDLGPLPAEPAPGAEGRVLVAARVGGTRLIDNLPLTLGRPPGRRTPTGTPTDGAS